MLQVLFWLVDGLVNVMDFGPIRQACCSRRKSEIAVCSTAVYTKPLHACRINEALLTCSVPHVTA